MRRPTDAQRGYSPIWSGDRPSVGPPYRIEPAVDRRSSTAKRGWVDEADRECRPPMRGYAAHLCERRDLGNTLDGACASDDRGHCRAYPARTIFSRFITPPSPEEAPGQWRSYFERWKIATRQSLGASQLDLVPELARYVPPATVVDKSTYSAFFRSRLAAHLVEKNVRTVVRLLLRDRRLRALDRARCREYRLSRRDRRGRALQLLRCRS